MPVRTFSTLDCEQEDDLSTEIRELRERIAHLETYYENTDVGLYKSRLEALEEQLKNRLKEM